MTNQLVVVVDQETIRDFMRRYLLQIQKHGQTNYKSHEDWAYDWGNLTNEALKLDETYHLRTTYNIAQVGSKTWFEKLAEVTQVPLLYHLIPVQWRPNR